jgi:hypothetical protein
MRTDDDPFSLFIISLLSGSQNRWDQICETFANPGACFNDEVLLVSDGSSDSIRHIDLFGARFVSFQSPRNMTFGS